MPSGASKVVSKCSSKALLTQRHKGKKDFSVIQNRRIQVVVGQPQCVHGMLWLDCPPDAFAALGAEDKKIDVVPSLDLVAARQGGPSGVELSPGDANGPRSSFDNELLGRICRAVKW